MLTKVTVHSQWANVDPLVLNITNRPETDLFESRNIDGLGSVKADVNTTSLGSVDGESFVGSNVGKRNIVFTIGLTPDWDQWTVSRLRRVLDKYFMPQLSVRMVFETMEFSPVEISGYVESNEPNMFSKDPEHVISVISPELYFKSVNPTVILGQTDMDPMEIDYEGNVETGMIVVVNGRTGAGTDPTLVKIRVNDPLENSIEVPSPVTLNEDYVMSSIPGDKYVRRVEADGDYVNLLNSAVILDNNDRDRRWPLIGPGTIDFAVTSDADIQEWVLTYHNLFGSL